MPESLFERLRGLELQPSPPPWVLNNSQTIHGLFDVGFAPDSDLLLTFSVDGLELFDCSTGKLLEYQEWPDDPSLQFDDIHLLAAGIGLLGGKSIRMAGIHGGGLTRQTS